MKENGISGVIFTFQTKLKENFFTTSAFFLLFATFIAGFFDLANSESYPCLYCMYIYILRQKNDFSMCV